MRATGSVTLPAPPAEVWQMLNDSRVLTRAIPGCEHLERAAPGAARFTVTAAVAGTAGTFTGEARLTASQPPHSLAAAIEALGEPGTLTATVAIRLAEGGGNSTELTYEAGADVTGQLAAVGRALLAGAATRLADRFFTALDGVLAAGPAQLTDRGRSPTEAAGAAPHAPDGAAPHAPDGAAPHAPGGTPRVPGAADQPQTAPGGPAGRWGAASLRRPGRGFQAGVLVGAALGAAAAKLGTLLARNRRYRRL